MQSINSHAPEGSNQNRLLNFDILMLLDDNYVVTTYKTAKETQPLPLAIKYQLRF